MFLIHRKYTNTSLTHWKCMYLNYLHACEKSTFRFINQIFTATEIRPRGITILKISKWKEKMLRWVFPWFSFVFKMIDDNLDRVRFSLWIIKLYCGHAIVIVCDPNSFRIWSNFCFVFSLNSKLSPITMCGSSLRSIYTISKWKEKMPGLLFS